MLVLLVVNWVSLVVEVLYLDLKKTIKKQMKISKVISIISCKKGSSHSDRV